MRRKWIARVSVVVVAALLGTLLGGAFAARPKRGKAAAVQRGGRARMVNGIPVVSADPPGVAEAMAKRQENLLAAALQYHGHNIGFDARVVEIDAGTLKEIQAAYQKSNPVHPDRLKRFAKHFENPTRDWVLNSWSGLIQAMEVSPNGGYDLTLKITPGIHRRSGGGIILTDYWLEHHHYDNKTGTVTVIDAAEDPNRNPLNFWVGT